MWEVALSKPQTRCLVGEGTIADPTYLRTTHCFCRAPWTEQATLVVNTSLPCPRGNSSTSVTLSSGGETSSDSGFLRLSPPFGVFLSDIFSKSIFQQLTVRYLAAIRKLKTFCGITRFTGIPQLRSGWSRAPPLCFVPWLKVLSQCFVFREGFQASREPMWSTWTHVESERLRLPLIGVRVRLFCPAQTVCFKFPILSSITGLPGGKEDWKEYAQTRRARYTNRPVKWLLLA
jgi:hypothetical protein